MPMVPEIYTSVCDVRDVATAHVNALVLPDAVAHRHLIVSTRETTSFADWARMPRIQAEKLSSAHHSGTQYDH